jgi:hypothetical protein
MFLEVMCCVIQAGGIMVKQEGAISADCVVDI